MGRSCSYCEMDGYLFLILEVFWDPDPFRECFMPYTNIRLRLKFGYIIYKTILNYYRPMSIEAVRASIRRSLERGGAALKVNDLMDQHGSKDWLRPLLDELGPSIQLQLADLTNLLEVMDNFYNFRNPSATVASLVLIATTFAIAAFTSADFSLKVFWFFAGMNFFVCWPISAHFPQYRLLVSPWKWTFWDIPTHAEWSVQYLQNRAQGARHAFVMDDGDGMWTRESTSSDSKSYEDDESISDQSFESAMTSPSESSHDVFSFRCVHLSKPGHLVVSTTGLRFDPSSISRLSPVDATFERSYLELVKMSKCHVHAGGLGSLTRLTRSVDKLELKFRGQQDDDGNLAQLLGQSREESLDVIMLENMRDRDRAFNAILGFSGLRWQCLQKQYEK